VSTSSADAAVRGWEERLGGGENVVARVGTLEGAAGEDDIFGRRAEGGGALDGDLALNHAGEDTEFDDVGGVLVEEFGDFGARAAA